MVSTRGVWCFNYARSGYPKSMIGTVRGVFTLPLSLPPKPRAETTTVQLRGPGVKQSVTVHPGESTVVRFKVSQRGPWTLNFSTKRPGYLSDGRPISVMGQMPTFAGVYCATAPSV